MAAESTEEEESECGERGGGVKVRRKARSGFIGFVLFSLVVGMGREGCRVGMGSSGGFMDLWSFVEGGGKVEVAEVMFVLFAEVGSVVGLRG